MKIEELINISNDILSDIESRLDCRMVPIDIRTIRYYQTMNILSMPKKTGKTANYETSHIKELIAIKYMQSKGYNLTKIASVLHSTDLDAILSNVWTLNSDSLVNNHIPSNNLQEKEETMKTENVVETKVEIVEEKPVKAIVADPNAETLSVLKTDHNFEAIKNHVHLGSSFAFIKGLSSNLAQELHILMHGQKSKGEINDAVIFVDETGINIPGATLSGRNVCGQKIGALLPDKDVYKEGDGIATLFVFDPSRPKEAKLSIFLDGAELDNIVVDLDENGCGLTRVPTYASGNYEVRLNGSQIKCSFVASKYELVPMSIILSGMSKTSDDQLKTSLYIERYSSPMTGHVWLSLIENDTSICQKILEIKDGIAEHTWDIKGLTSQLYIRATDEEDKTIVAQIPLTGTKQSERIDTEIGSLGRVTSISMLESSSAISERGLWFSNGAVNNSPISIVSHIDDKLRLKFNVNCDFVTIAIRDQLTGESSVKELGTKKKGTTCSLPLLSSFNFVNIGAFIDGSPWEGHAIATMKSKGKLEVVAPKTIKPNSKVKIKLKTDGKSSVFLKIVDNRLKTTYDPMDAVASAVKDWARDTMVNGGKNRVTGYVGNQLSDVIANDPIGKITYAVSAWPANQRYGSRMDYGDTIGATIGDIPDYQSTVGYSGGGNWMSMSSPTVANVSYSSSLKSSNLSIQSISGQSANLSTQLSSKLMANPPIVNSPDLKAHISSMFDSNPHITCEVNRMMGGREYKPIQASGTYIYQSRDKNPMEKNKVQMPLPRESMADVLFADLIQVNKEKDITISLSDSMGVFDIKAFSVSGTDWNEYETTIKVEKEFYIEPIIPYMVHPEDDINCRAVIVHPPKDAIMIIKVDGKTVKSTMNFFEDGIHLSWKATPGIHEVLVMSQDGESDSIMRTIEAPGEEIVFAQQIKLLKKGERFDLAEDGGLSVKVLPGMESEIGLSIQVLLNYEHSCCEQTAAKMVAAALSVLVGNDNEKVNAYKSIISGVNRLASMYVNLEDGTKTHFSYYPHGNRNDWASSIAAIRGNGVIECLKDTKLPKDVSNAIESLKNMVDSVLVCSDKAGMMGKLELAYYENQPIQKTDILDINGNSFHNLSETAYAASIYLRDKDFESGIFIANNVAKLMRKNNGNGWHGTCETLAYMQMIKELKNSGIVAGAGNTKSRVKINGVTMSLGNAMEMRDISDVESLDGGIVALKISRLEKMRLDQFNDSVSMSVDIVGENDEKNVKSGHLAKLKVKMTTPYQNGDVLCVVLPNSLSRMIGGAKVKKFQIDFAGKQEVAIDLVAHDATPEPQRWFAAVRNMYDSGRIGSVGLLTTKVS